MAVLEQVTDLEDLLDEDIECEIDGCLSQHEVPPTWFGTHKDAGPECSIMMCVPCKNHMMMILVTSRFISMGRLDCPQCGTSGIPVEDFILRPL